MTMKTKYSFIALVVLIGGLLCACEDKLDIEQHGVSTIESFYQTDDDADEAITVCYDQMKTIYRYAYILKNMLSDDCYNGGESWTAGYYQLSTYTFDADNSVIETLYEAYYTLIYEANLVIENVAGGTDIQDRDIAEAYVFRAFAYIDLISLWGTPSYVDHCLTSSEYAQPNGDPDELWALVESDLTTAINSGDLSEKSSVDDICYRINKQFAQALLGKAYVFQEEWSSALSVLEDVIDSGLYELEEDMSDLLTTRNEFNKETLFESNYVYDANNISLMGDMLWAYTHWRSDMLDFNINETLYDHNGWGFFNPTYEVYQAFVELEGEDGYRLNNSIKTYQQMKDLEIISDTGLTVTFMNDNAGLFPWKYRLYADDLILSFYVRCPNNFRWMRYSEVLLLAAEAALETGNTSKATTYIDVVRTRAQLESCGTATMDILKKEKRCELFQEGVRYQDLIRWGDAYTYLGTKGQERPALYPDGTVDMDYLTTSSAGFKTGKHELLPFPATEINVNKNITQNTGW